MNPEFTLNSITSVYDCKKLSGHRLTEKQFPFNCNPEVLGSSLVTNARGEKRGGGGGRGRKKQLPLIAECDS